MTHVKAGGWSEAVACPTLVVNCPFSGYLHAHRGGDRGHAEEDSGAGLRHPPGPCWCQDAADGPAGISWNHSQPGKVSRWQFYLTRKIVLNSKSNKCCPVGAWSDVCFPLRVLWRWLRFSCQKSPVTPNCTDTTTSFGSASKTSPRGTVDVSGYNCSLRLVEKHSFYLFVVYPTFHLRSDSTVG